ncbi:MAG: hypothetical protein K0S56_935 [Microvirga sp.]|jgi:hypothetical protein|nr:hypothetical protein [Microvirga sp.]
MTNLNRRAFLRATSVAGVSAAAALPIVATAATPAIAHDGGLVRLGKIFSAQAAAYLAARVRLEAAADQARAVWPLVPEDMRVRRAWPTGNTSECPVSFGYGYERGERQEYSVIDHGDLEYRLATALRLRPRVEKSKAEKAEEVEYWSEAIRRLDAYEAECEAIRARFGIPALVDARLATSRDLIETMQQIYSTPAETIAGLAVKALVLESEAAHLADVVTAKFKMPGSIARDIAWISTGARGQ